MLLFLFTEHEKNVRLCALPVRVILVIHKKACGCAPAVVAKYQKRIPGTLLDRINIYIEAPRVYYEKLSGDRMGGD